MRSVFLHFVMVFSILNQHLFSNFGKIVHLSRPYCRFSSSSSLKRFWYLSKAVFVVYLCFFRQYLADELINVLYMSKSFCIWKLKQFLKILKTNKIDLYLNSFPKNVSNLYVYLISFLHSKISKSSYYYFHDLHNS